VIHDELSETHLLGQVANYVDERTGAAKWMKKNFTKVFPDHWSFLLGEMLLVLIHHSVAFRNILNILV
jgi:hypothetical protein